MIMRITRDYDRPIIEITENGCSYGDAPDANGVVHDTRRIDFYRGYLEAVSRAIEDGAEVRGYHAWTLLDNFEWSEGYEQRFGLAWVDFESPQRTAHPQGVGALVRARRGGERLRELRRCGRRCELPATLRLRFAPPRSSSRSTGSPIYRG